MSCYLSKEERASMAMQVSLGVMLARCGSRAAEVPHGGRCTLPLGHSGKCGWCEKCGEKVHPRGFKWIGSQVSFCCWGYGYKG